MATENLVKGLKKSISEILGFKDKNLISKPQWGTINFENAQQDYDRIFSIINYLDVLPLKLLTDEIINHIISAINEIIPKLDQIDKFDIEKANASQLRNNLISQVHQIADKLFEVASTWIPFLAYQKGDVAKNIESLTDSLKQAEVLVSKAKEDIKVKSDEIGTIITTAREASSAAGAAVFTEDFANESKSLNDNAGGWLKATLVLAVITVILSFITWFWTPAGLDKGQIWQKLGSRIFTLGILLTGTLWCGRIYKALKHQATINKHRALSLQTFQAFSHAASDDQTKNAVLLETTRSIFGKALTGYVDSKSGSGESEPKIIEIVRSIAEKE